MSACIDWLLAHPEFGLDVETNPLKQFFLRKTRLVQVGDREKQWVIDLRAFVDSGDELSDAQGDYGSRLHKYPRLQAVIKSLQPFLESNLFLKVGVNLGFEYTQFYYGFGVRMFNLYDCQMCERVIQAGYHSLKDFDFYSMESLMDRYFGLEIDKTLQTSFDVDNVLTQAQYEYAALDVRFPFPIRKKQLIIGDRDKLLRVFQLENDAVGSFAEMHIHGEKLDTAKWKKNTDEAKEKRLAALKKLDGIFFKFVGSKLDIVTDEMVDNATAAWKKFNEVTPAELALRAEMKLHKLDEIKVKVLKAQEEKLVTARKAEKERLKKVASELGKRRTVLNKLQEKCQGDALINYDSNAQVYKVLVENFPGLKKLKSTNDVDLGKFTHVPVIEALRDYREWDKRVATYGDQWMKEWLTHPCNEEGWLSPFDHLLHSVYNQLLAETGRSSSDNPNGQNVPHDPAVRQCFIAGDGLVYVTCDMSGAELRIIAELAKAKSWIEAFKRGEDVHSVCTEILFPVEWKMDACKGGEIAIVKGKEVVLPPCAYYKTKEDGTFAKKKCKCPKHNARRDKTKSLNFGIAYGMLARTLADRTGMSIEEAEHIMALHQQKFPDIWAYLTKSGILAKSHRQARDMFGRRRAFPAPTTERARESFIDRYKDRLLLSDELQKRNLDAYFEKYGKKATGEIKFWLTHREPTPGEINKSFIAIEQGIERQGKNHCIQGTNASIAKVAMGSGFDKDGKPFLFHILPQYNAKLIKFVHDELVVRCTPEVAQDVAAAIADAFRRAAAETMTEVVMEAEFKISTCWEK